MNILYFNPGRSVFGRRLLARLESEGLASSITVYRDLEVFFERLRQRVKDRTIAVVVAPTESSLLDIYFMKHLFSGIDLVLILPDRQNVAAAVGWRCGPRSIFYGDSDLSEMAEALRALSRNFNIRLEPDGFEHQYEAA